MNEITFYILGFSLAVSILGMLGKIFNETKNKSVGVIFGISVIIIILAYFTNPSEEELNNVIRGQYRATLSSTLSTNENSMNFITNLGMTNTRLSRYNFGWISINDISIDYKKIGTYIGFMGKYYKYSRL